jgi:hypothetical protein
VRKPLASAVRLLTEGVSVSTINLGMDRYAARYQGCSALSRRRTQTRRLRIGERPMKRVWSWALVALRYSASSAAESSFRR